jgi:hypothetical protein
MTKDFDIPGFTDFKRAIPDPDSPVYPSLMSMMKADLVLNPESDIWLIHDQPLPEVVKWIEYDIELETLILVSVSGKIQGFGQKIPPAMKKYMGKGRMIHLIYFDMDLIQDMSIVPLIVREELKSN